MFDVVDSHSRSISAADTCQMSSDLQFTAVGLFNHALECLLRDACIHFEGCGALAGPVGNAASRIFLTANDVVSKKMALIPVEERTRHKHLWSGDASLINGKFQIKIRVRDV